MHEVHEFPHTVDVRHEMLEVRDGTRLSARIWLPEDADEVPVPALLEYIPYRHRDVTRARDARNHPYLAGHGYASVRVDLRGSGDSEGLLLDEYTQAELEDAEDVIAWLADQPWCNGAVGMFGISWGGFNSLQVAARRPPALKAIISCCATEDLYVDNMHYMGGCLLSDNLSEATVMFAFNSLPPDPAVVGDRWHEMWMHRLENCEPWVETWLRHPLRDAYWRTASVREDYSAIQVPVLAVGGWADGYTNAIFRLLEHLEVPTKGLIGPWGHRYPHDGQPGPAAGFLQESLRWWDRWLRGLDTGVEDDPALRVWLQDSVAPHTSYEERPGRWIALETYPSDQIEDLALHCGADRSLSQRPVETAPHDDGRRPLRSPLSVGLFAGKWASYAAPPDLPYDQREEDGGALVFETAPLDEPVEIVGQPAAHLTVWPQGPEAQIAVRISDVHPEGEATRVTYGLLDLRHRDGSEQPTPLRPGEPHRVTVTCNGVAQRFPAGHRIRMSISTSYWPLAWPPPVLHTTDVDVTDSLLSLPVRDPSLPDGEAPATRAEGAPALEVTTEAPSDHAWRVIRDLASDRSCLEIVNDQGAFVIDEVGTRVRRATWEWYRAEAEDVTSAQGETETWRSLSRGDWNVQIRTWTRLRCTENDFVTDAELDAFEGIDELDRRRVFARSWHRVVPRDRPALARVRET